jgi:hypothetical protein
VTNENGNAHRPNRKKPVRKRRKGTKPGPKPSRRVTAKELREIKFADALIANGGNGTKAAIAAGYSADTAKIAAARLLTSDNVQARIRGWLDQGDMTPKEVLGRLASQARADLLDCMDENGRFDLRHMRDLGMGHLIKTLRVRQIKGEHGAPPAEILTIELYDKQKADELLGRYMRLEKAPVTNNFITIERERDRIVHVVRSKVRRQYKGYIEEGIDKTLEDAWIEIVAIERDSNGRDVTPLKEEVIKPLLLIEGGQHKSTQRP